MKRIALIVLALLGGSPAWGQTLKADAHRCRHQYGTWVEVARCHNAVEDRYVRPGFSFPDLLTQMQRARVAIAWKVQNGELPEEQFMPEFERVRAELLAIGYSRLYATPQNSMTCITYGTGELAVTMC